MPRIMSASRYLVLIPVIGLLFAAAAFFVLGGFGLISSIWQMFADAFSGVPETGHNGLPIEVAIVEYVHRFLIGTVLFITAAGLYQLFIHEVEFPAWLHIESTEELETNLIGVTIVVLAVNFMGIVFTRDAQELMSYGIGIALPIAALSLYVGLRAWSTARTKESEAKFNVLRQRGTIPPQSDVWELDDEK